MPRRTASRGLLLAAGLLLPTGVGAGPDTGLGPAPRDADGRFENGAGPLPRAGPSVTLPFFVRRAFGAFRSAAGAPARVANDGAFLRENAVHSVPALSWVGHATLLVQMDHVTFLTDPIWSATASPLPFAGPRRFVPPGIALEALPPVDFVLVSHDHYDHLDLGSLRRLAERRAETRFFVPLGNAERLRDAGIANVVELDWGESRPAGGAVAVHCLPAQHWSRRGLRDERRTLWASWAVTGPERRFYFGGDTGWFDGFARIAAAHGPFDVAALPIGAYEPQAMMRPFHLDPEQAVRAGIALGARHLLGVHFGTFDLSDEPLDEPPARFRAAGAAAGLGPERLWLLAVGETRRW